MDNAMRRTRWSYRFNHNRNHYIVGHGCCNEYQMCVCMLNGRTDGERRRDEEEEEECFNSHDTSSL